MNIFHTHTYKYFLKFWAIKFFPSISLFLCRRRSWEWHRRSLWWLSSLYIGRCTVKQILIKTIHRHRLWYSRLGTVGGDAPLTSRAFHNSHFLKILCSPGVFWICSMMWSYCKIFRFLKWILLSSHGGQRSTGYSRTPKY